MPQYVGWQFIGHIVWTVLVAGGEATMGCTLLVGCGGGCVDCTLRQVRNGVQWRASAARRGSGVGQTWIWRPGQEAAGQGGKLRVRKAAGAQVRLRVERRE